MECSLILDDMGTPTSISSVYGSILVYQMRLENGQPSMVTILLAAFQIESYHDPY